MADIFISYAREDRQRVKSLAEALMVRGWSVWWDARIRAGQHFDEMIEREIGRASCVIVAWTERSVGSQWVRAEAAEALEQGKLVPVFLAPVKPPLLFRHVHGFDLQQWQGSADDPLFQRLIEDIAELAGPPSKPQGGPASDVHTDGTAPGARQAGAKHSSKRVPVEPSVPSMQDPSLPEQAMIRIEPGTFLMGCPAGEDGYDNEKPQHQVRITRPFAIGKYAVTCNEYDAFAEATNRDLPEDEGWGRGRRPVINVSWEDAVAYAQWLSRETGRRYRLPTEAEWEYAARAGTTTPYSTGECIDTDLANYDGNQGWGECPKTGVYREQTLEVGSLPANPWGLHEVHGNVWEWVQDCWHESYQGAPADGSSWEGGDFTGRVVRGGSWPSAPGTLRSAYRGGSYADSRNGNIGFRLAQDI